MVRVLGDIVRAAADGWFPPQDGRVEVVPSYLPGVEAMVCFTAHAVAATAVPVEVLLDVGADGLGGATSGRVMQTLAGPDGELGVLDLLLAHCGTGRSTLPERADLADHPRAAHARDWRSDVRVHGDERGLVTVSRGLGGLAEVSFEVPDGARGEGRGRALLRAALGLVAAGDPVIAAVAPGNAASLRAVLATGFVPLGSVQLVRPRRPR